MNPKYKGQGRYGHYRKVERLYDINDPAAGNVTRMSPASVSAVVETEGIVPAIVSESVWRQAQIDRAPEMPGPRPDRPQHTRYALRGLLVCARCGRRMQGHTVNRRQSSERVGYQCTYRNDYPADENHPKTLFVAEHRVLPAVDEWLADLSSPERLQTTVAAILHADNHQSSEPAELRRARRRAQEAGKKLDQYLAALDAGLDPVLVTERTRVAQVELASAAAVIDAYEGSGPGLLSAQEVRDLLGKGRRPHHRVGPLGHRRTPTRVPRCWCVSSLSAQRGGRKGHRVATRGVVACVGGPDYAKPEWRMRPLDLRR